MRRTYAWVATALLAGVAPGCSSDAPPLVPVQGRVTLDGKPLAGKTVKFVPEDGTSGQGAGATTNAEGEYTLLAARPGAVHDTPGAPPGAYRVVVVEPMFPLDLPVQKSDDTTPTPAIGIPAPTKKKQDIPSAYTSADTTTLRANVTKGGGAIDLELETPTKK